MKKSKAIFKPKNKSYVQLKIGLSGKTIVLGMGLLGIASGLNYFLKYLVRKYAYKTVYGKLPPEECCRDSREKKKTIGFACEPISSE